MRWRAAVGSALAVAVGLLAADGAAGQTGRSLDVPLRSGHGWFLVPVVANGSDSLVFIVDTGAGISAVTESTAARLGLGAGMPVIARGASGSQQLRMTVVPSLAFGDVVSRDVRTLVLQDATLTPDGAEGEGGRAPVDGVLGIDLLGPFDVLLDPLSGVMRLYEGDARPPSAVMDRLAEPLPLRRMLGGLYGHDVLVSGVGLPAILDTGARHVIMSRAAADAAGVEGLRATTPSRGVGSAPVEMMEGRVESLRVGGTAIPPLDVHIGDLPLFRSQDGEEAATMLLGNPAVRGCLLLFSLREGTVRYCRVVDAGRGDGREEVRREGCMP